jgi:GalNAc-alpha-(1->4)-GalNAc-alpha-(1->3)-diNAcBac-PP-undecaprenol alpha-1,4-N-acetyl-D-galactosaminyltransferase
MRITLVITSLERGGAERVISRLASWWAEEGRDVTLLPLNSHAEPAYDLHEKVQRVSLGLPPGRDSLASIFRKIKKVFVLRRYLRENPSDVIVSFIDRSNILTLLASRGLGIPVVVSERTVPASYDIGIILSSLRRLVYPQASAIVCQTHSVVRWLRKRFQVPVYAIPNPVPSVPFSSQAERKKTTSQRTMIAVGRLTHEKGFDLLLEAFSRVAGAFPEWRLSILGSGPLKEELEARSDALNLADRISFVGACADPFPALRAADLFVLSSRFEGFPNALTEAMACGLPVISFDCPWGPGEIIRHEVDGLLVPPEDVAALAAALARLMASPQERERLAARAPDVVERFSKEKVLDMWNQVFDALLIAKPAGEKAKTPQESETCRP